MGSVWNFTISSNALELKMKDEAQSEEDFHFLMLHSSEKYEQIFQLFSGFIDFWIMINKGDLLMFISFRNEKVSFKYNFRKIEDTYAARNILVFN